MASTGGNLVRVSLDGVYMEQQLVLLLIHDAIH
jgi:hypothetical protein